MFIKPELNESLGIEFRSPLFGGLFRVTKKAEPAGQDSEPNKKAEQPPHIELKPLAHAGHFTGAAS